MENENEKRQTDVQGIAKEINNNNNNNNDNSYTKQRVEMKY